MNIKTYVLLILTTLLAGCLPTAKEQACSSGSVFNSSSRSCVPITSGGQTSGLSISTRSPIVSNVTVAQTQTATTAFAVTIANPLNQGFEVRWMLYPPSGVGFPPAPIQVNTNLASSTYGLVPQSLGLVPGLWTLAAEVYSLPSSTLATSAQWALTVTSNPTPTLVINPGLSSFAGTSTSIQTNALVATQLAVNVVDTSPAPTAWRLYWSFDGVASSPSAFTSNTGSVNGLTQTFLQAGATPYPNDNPIMPGPHVVRAELRSPGGSVYDTIEWTIFAYAPNMPQLSAAPFAPNPTSSTVVTAIDGVNIASGGFRNAGVNMYNAAAGAGAFCVAVTTAVGSGGGVAVQFRKNGNPILGPQTFMAANSFLCLDDFASTEAFTLSNPNIGEFRTLSADIVDLGTSTVAVTVTWGVSVRPRNTPPVATLPPPIVNPIYRVQDTAGTQTFLVEDADTALMNMNITFYIDGVAMDGINTFPGTNVLTPDCSHIGYPIAPDVTPGTGPVGATRLDCTVSIPSYDLNGRVNPAMKSYTITAMAQDKAINGAAAQTSNLVSWTVNPVNPGAPQIKQTVPTIVAQGTNLTTTSYITTLANPTVILDPTNGATPFIPEGTDIVFSTLVNDIERDDFFIQVDRCTNAGCTTTQPAVAPILITRSTDALGRRAALTYNIPEDTIVGAANGTVQYRITVKDVLPDIDANVLTDTDTQTVIPGVNVAQTAFMDLKIANNNPFPLWAGAAGTNPQLANAVIVMTGMPVSIDPGTITDASVADGNAIVYRWQVKVGAGPWETIPGATSRVLKWTPSNAIATLGLEFRLCLGDDGFGNEVTLCTNFANPTAPALPATTRFAGPWTGITARSNAIAKNAALPAATGEVATWFDNTERELYMAYVHKAGTNDSRIVVEKYEVALNGTVTSGGSVTFATEETGAAYDASALSIVGQRVTIGADVYRGLYVSYVTQDAPSVSPRIRVRRIELTNDEMVFNYNNFYESNTLSQDIQVIAGGVAGQITLQVVDNVFDASEYIIIAGIRLNAVTTVPANDCEFRVGGLLTTDEIITNIANAYSTCSASDPRAFIPSGTIVGNQWAITNYPQDHVDLDYSIYLGKAGEIMLQNDTLLIPYLDNLNSGKVAIAVLSTTTNGFTSGSLGRTSFPYSQVPSYVALNGTVQGFELTNSYAENGLFDVAITTVGNRVNAYRMSFNTPSTVGIVDSVINVFGASELVEKPRIATGRTATNNHVFILAQNANAVEKDLFYARVDVANSYQLASGLPQNPLDGTHEQSLELTDYRIRALEGNKRAVMGVYTNSLDILVSILKPAAALSELVMIRPTAGAGATYPTVDELPAFPVSTVPNVALSMPFDFTVGDAGSVALENVKESVLMLYPSSAASGLRASILNVEEETIQATSNGTPYQPPYIK